MDCSDKKRISVNETRMHVNDTRAYVRKLHRDFVRVQAECERSRQLIRESRHLMASVSEQTNSSMSQRALLSPNERSHHSVLLPVHLVDGNILIVY
jgi:hypothetical protein